MNYLQVVSNFEIVGEVDRVSAGHVTERLEVVHGKSVTLDPHTTDELSQDVEGDLDTGHSLDDTDGNDEDQCKDDTVWHNSRGSVSGPSANASETKTNSNEQDGEVPPFRYCRLQLDPCPNTS
jgi:hypothetical protein